jgi:hypothetical protein
MEDDNQLPPWLGNPTLNTGDDEEGSPTIGMRMAGRVPPPPPAPAPAPPMPKIDFDPSRIPASIRPQPRSPSSVPPPPTGGRKLSAVPGVYGLSAVPGLFAPPAAPAGNAAPPPMPKIDFDPTKIPESIRPRPLTPGEVSAPGQNQNLVEHLKQRAAIGNPTDPSAVDPTTGKPMYRLGVGGRVLGTAANFLQGFGKRPFTPTYVGPDATNARYDRDETMRQGKVTNLDAQIKGDEQLSSENEKLYRDALNQAYKAQLGEKDVALGKAAEENAATKRMLEASQAARNQADADKKSATPSDQRTKDADAQGLTGQARKDYILTGKLPKDFAGAGRAPSDLEMWHNAFVRDNKREPTADELSNRRVKTDTKSDQIEKDKDTALAKAEEETKKHLDKLDLMGFVRDPTKPLGETMKAWAQRKQQEAYADLEKNKGQIQKEYETRAAANSSRGPGARPGVAPDKAASKIDPNNLPKTVMVNGKERRVVGYNQKTGKVQVATEGEPVSIDEAKDYLKRAGGDKDKARQMAKQDGRAF